MQKYKVFVNKKFQCNQVHSVRGVDKIIEFALDSLKNYSRMRDARQLAQSKLATCTSRALNHYPRVSRWYNRPDSSVGYDISRRNLHKPVMLDYV